MINYKTMLLLPSYMLVIHLISCSMPPTWVSDSKIQAGIASENYRNESDCWIYCASVIDWLLYLYLFASVYNFSVISSRYYRIWNPRFRRRKYKIQGQYSQFYEYNWIEKKDDKISRNSMVKFQGFLYCDWSTVQHGSSWLLECR